MSKILDPWLFSQGPERSVGDSVCCVHEGINAWDHDQMVKLLSHSTEQNSKWINLFNKYLLSALLYTRNQR